MLMVYKPRDYRGWVKAGGLISFEVVEKETDLFISADSDLKEAARASILTYRQQLESYIRSDRRFFSSLEPVGVAATAPDIVKAMAEAGKKARVGPMAAIAGAMAEFVGKDLLKYSSQVIVENGGDIFLKTAKPAAIGIFAGQNSKFTGKLVIEVDTGVIGMGVCTSSGTVSHSLSFGKADAALMISPDAALADAAATAAGNAVKSAADIKKALDVARSIDGVTGAVIIVGDKMGSWGSVKLV
jgi:ApbE superfamily uncharacterized protein (UPF0280 family)